MADDTIVKVERNVMDLRRRAKISTQYGTPSHQYLPDEARHQMGGEPIVYFFAQSKDGRWVLLQRAPKQNW